MASKARRAAALFILFTVLLDMLSFGIVIPVLPKLVEEFLSGDTARAAEIFGFMGTACALMHHPLAALGASFRIYIPNRVEEG